eukprot:14793957-Alexandrium_andersonii.AAC.1
MSVFSYGRPCGRSMSVWCPSTVSRRSSVLGFFGRDHACSAERVARAHIPHAVQRVPEVNGVAL